VSWGDASLAVAMQETMRLYLTDVWRRFSFQLVAFLVRLEWAPSRRESALSRLGSIVLCPKTAALILQRMIHQASFDETFPAFSRPALAVVSRSIHAVVAWTAWDSDITVTEYFLSATLHRLLATCRAALLWTTQTAQQLMSSRTVEGYLLLMLSDLQMIIDEGHDAVNTCRSVAEKNISLNTDAVSCTSFTVHIPDGHLVQELISIVDGLKAQYDGFPKQFRQMCLIGAKEFFAETMPAMKDWKRKAGDGFPIQHNDYIESAMETLIQPVLTSMNWLQMDGQVLALSTAVTAVCEAWTSYFLTQKVRFSYLGACQLELDILYVRTWLDSYVTESSVRAVMSTHDGLMYMDAVVALLKQQPVPAGGGRKQQRQSNDVQKTKNNNKNVGRDDQLRSNGNTSQRCSLFGQQNRSIQSDPLPTRSGDIDDMTSVTDGDVSKSLPYRDQWLALRVQGGARGWSRFTSCLSSDS
jgi:hypothetical protein